MFKKILSFWHSHPGLKTAVVGAVGAGIGAAAQGSFGPKAMVAATAVSALYGLFVKRPKDATLADKGTDGADVPDVCK